MEEYIWSLVELFISGQATEDEVSELTYLLGTHPDLLRAVKGFLEEYQDADPQVTTLQKKVMLIQAEQIRQEFGRLARPSHFPQKEKLSPAGMLRREGLVWVQLIKTTTRQLRRNRAISLINISGLAIGMATAILIFMWITNEFSYDRFHRDKDRIYELYSQRASNGQLEANGALPSILAPVIKANYPQVEAVNRLSGVGSFVLKHNDQRFEGKGLLTDPNFFKFFNYKFAKGDPATALAGIHNIVLTQEMAGKLFGKEDPLGKIVKIDSIANFTVTGVLEPLPANTQFNYVEYMVPLSYMKEVHWQRDDWRSNTVNMFVMMKPGVDRRTADQLFWNIFRGKPMEAATNGILQPMADLWLYDDYRNGKFLPGRLVMLRWFGLIAILVMVIACINYMNLGTARSAKRAKEVGIRKVAGASRGLLIKQFLGESVLTAIAAGALSIWLVQLCLPAFDHLIANDRLRVPYGNVWFWLAVGGFATFTGLLAGVYPACYLSAYRPAKVLKGILSATGALLTPRKVMVVVQFTLAIGFIICTLVIYRQIDLAWHRSKGYDTNGLAYVYIKGDIQKNYPVIKNELEESGAITAITRTNSSVNDTWTANNDYSWRGKDPSLNFTLFENFTDQDLTKTSGIKLLEGRDIDIYHYPGDTSSVLLTQTAVKMMGLKAPVGQLIKRGGSTLQVVGVIRDYVAGWAYEAPRPRIIRGSNAQLSAVNFRLNRAQPANVNLAKIGAIFRKYNPDYPFMYYFVDETYAKGLEGDKNIGTMAATFAGLTIFISCMGLFALAAFMAENRIKEIGIRKVLGASVAAITTLLSKDFLVLVGIAFIIASPIAWWLMNKWLENYPLHIEIGYWVFILTGATSILIALVTVGSQAFKAAMLSPIKNLRTE